MRTTRLFRAVRVAAGAAALAFVLTPSAVLADCMMPPAVEEAARNAEIVFVGTVTETTTRSTWANVAVEEVWRGPDLPATVVVKGGSGGDGISSVERSFRAGVKYLFFPYAGEDGDLADNICTNTTEWTDGMEKIRPAGVRQPLGSNEAEGGLDLGSVVAPLGVALLVAGALLVTGLVARGRAS